MPTIHSYLGTLGAAVILYAAFSVPASAQLPDLAILNKNRSVLDAHNCYPYEKRWSDRITRALQAGWPVGIEQDLAWYVDPATGKGRPVVTHKAETDGSEPSLRQYFFERVRPIVEQALQRDERSKWPLIVVHFDFKDNQPALLGSVWDLLSEYEDWITTAMKTGDPHHISPLDLKPLLVLTEDPDAQEEVFFNQLAVGGKMRIFGSAHTRVPQNQDRAVREHILVSTAPEELLPDRATNYRRWWNNSWHDVEEGGQQKAGTWTKADTARLQKLVDHAHRFGYWIRFYTLDGFDAATGRENGWFNSYNFGSLAAVQQRWTAALKVGVDLIATDQYEDLAQFMKATANTNTPAAK